MKLIKWFAAIFEDQSGSPSSKRFTLFICLFFLWMIIKGNLEGKTVDQEVLFVIGALILFCIGAVTGEFIGKIWESRK